MTERKKVNTSADKSQPVIADVKDQSEMKSKGIGKWTIIKPTNDGSGGYTTYETSDVAEVREAGRRGWGISQHIQVDFGDDPTIDNRSLEESAAVGYLSETKATKPGTVTDEMVSRFLAWKLPKDFCPDCYIAFDREKASQGSWPVGTNLLHAEQARAMLEHVIAAPAIDASPDNSQAVAQMLEAAGAHAGPWEVKQVQNFLAALSANKEQK